MKMNMKNEEYTKRLAIAEKKLREAIELVKQQGVGVGMGVSEAKVLDLLTSAHSLLLSLEAKENIRKNDSSEINNVRR